MNSIDLNISVFTTAKILLKNLPILYVVHDLDGEWQFLSGEVEKVEDIMIVTIKKILDYDPSIRPVLDIENGYEAKRLKVDGEWNIIKI